MLGSQQTPYQDVEFAVNQLVEVAVRALSPSVNDPFTATACVDHLGAALCRLAGRKIPSPYRRDPDGQVRVTDGPYSESKEVLGGYYIIEAASYDNAVEHAQSCPHLEYGGTIEVRQIQVMARPADKK